MTTDQIAGRSGVSKATLCKWWPNKFAIAVEAFLREETVVSPVPDTGSAREDYRIWLRNTVDLFAGPYGRFSPSSSARAGQSQTARGTAGTAVGPRRRDDP